LIYKAALFVQTRVHNGQRMAFLYRKKIPIAKLDSLHVVELFVQENVIVIG